MEYILLFEQFGQTIANDGISGKQASTKTINDFKFSNGRLITDKVIIIDPNDENGFYNKEGQIVSFIKSDRTNKIDMFTEWVIEFDDIEGEFVYLDDQFLLI